MVHKEILRARAIPRDALLEKANNQEKQNKITFNITYHPVFRDVRKILEELHVILASDDGHKKVFPDVPMIGFKINKNLKAHLVRLQLPDLDEVGRSKPSGGKRSPCHLCENMKDTCTFKSKHLKSDSYLSKKIIFICFNESPLKIVKNAFYFILKALFVIKIFKFLL